MARSPLIFETPVGTFYAIDLGAGVCALVIHGDGGAQSYPLDAAMALRLQAWLSGGKRGVGRRPGAQTVTDEDLQELVDAYNSEEAGHFDGSRARYCAQLLGVTETTVYNRLTRAKDRGLYSGQAD